MLKEILKSPANHPPLIKALGGIIIALIVFLGIVLQLPKIETKVPTKSASNISTAASISIRKLQPLETGKYIADLPDGIYGFANATAIQYEIEDTDNYVKFLDLSSQKLKNYSFEIQKRDGSYYLLGFIGDESFSRIGEAIESKPLDFILLPSTWDLAKNPVEIPFNAIQKINKREIDTNQRETFAVIDVITTKITAASVIHTGDE